MDMMEIKSIVGKNLRKIRKSHGYTQEELAEMIGIERKSISHIETGHSAISYNVMQKICDKLHISAVELFFNELPQTQNEKLIQTINTILKFSDEKLDYAFLIIKAISKK